MNQKILILIFLAGLAIAGFVFLKTQNNTPPVVSIPTGMVLYYGTGCPHCVVVDDYIKNNKVQEKITFEQKEVFNNKTNQSEFIAVAKGCGIPDEKIGVPLFWDGSKCLVGDVDIIDFFKRNNAE